MISICKVLEKPLFLFKFFSLFAKGILEKYSRINVNVYKKKMLTALFRRFGRR